MIQLNPSPNAIEELKYDAYQHGQWERLSERGLKEDVALACSAGRSFRDGDGWVAAYQRGYAVLSMVTPAWRNARALDLMNEHRDALTGFDPTGELLYGLPSESFHQTLANTLSGDRLSRELYANGSSEQDFRLRLADAMSAIPQFYDEDVLWMRLIGIGIVGSSIGVLGVFDSEKDLARIHRLRDSIYGDAELARLGVRRARAFVGQITLGYFVRQLTPTEQGAFATLLARLNVQWRRERSAVVMATAEARLFRHGANVDIIPGMPAAAI